MFEVIGCLVADETYNIDMIPLRFPAHLLHSDLEYQRSMTCIALARACSSALVCKYLYFFDALEFET